MSDIPILAAAGVTRRFGSVAAVDKLSLDFKANEFFALLGPSGCGKTTLLRILAGFEKPDEGRVLLEGKDITALRPNKRPLNMMFQSYALFPHMSVEANVAYGLEMEGLGREDIRRKMDETLATTQLSSLAKRKPHQLSGGQRQRVALARALVKRPKVLLLDEPLGALDKKLRGEMQLELKRLQHDVGITFVIVTHDQEEALVMADRVALMNAGRIAQLGAPAALYEKPANRFVAGFIGDMNFIEGTASAAGLDVPGLGTLRGSGDLRPGERATLAVRPERLAIGGSGENRVQGRLTDLAYHGQDVLLQIGVPGLGAPLRARLPIGTFEQENLAPGAEVAITFATRHAQILAE